MDRLLSVVVSVYNEEKALEEFYRETTHVLEQISWDYELLFVNDGSRDEARTYWTVWPHLIQGSG